jgi:hypothetical protein
LLRLVNPILPSTSCPCLYLSRYWFVFTARTVLHEYLNHHRPYFGAFRRCMLR